MSSMRNEPEATAARPPSMADVASLAGVSHQTVSRVLNEHPNVREATKERVLAAISTLGYRRNTAARALATARSSTIGILTVGNAYFGPSHTVLGVESAARAEGFFVSVHSLETYDAGAAGEALERLADQGVEGIVVVAPIAAVAHAVEQATLGVPVVVVAANPDAHPAPHLGYVCTDQGAGARAVAEHLWELGHRRFAHVSGDKEWFDARQRLDAWAAALAAHEVDGAEYPAERWEAAGGYAQGLRIADDIARGSGPTAVFAANDDLAVGLLRALWERGIAVPGDVSVVGFDDLESSEFYTPSLTTVRQPFAEMGRAALRLLLDIASGASRVAMGFDAVLEPELIVRGSTAPPAPRESPGA